VCRDVAFEKNTGRVDETTKDSSTVGRLDSVSYTGLRFITRQIAGVFVVAFGFRRAVVRHRDHGGLAGSWP
jgi:hypothetical protein